MIIYLSIHRLFLTNYLSFCYSSMKQNLVVLLADLFNLFEIHPAKCVCYPGMDSQGKRLCFFVFLY